MAAEKLEDPLHRAYRKRKAKQDLTAEEREALSAQQKSYAGRTTRLYCESPHQLDKWRRLAKQDGYTSFSGWVVDQVHRAVSGEVVDPIEFGRLQERLVQNDEEISYHRIHSRTLEDENKALQAEIRRLTTEIADLTRLITDRLGKIASE